MTPITNDTQPLTPRTTYNSRVLEYDFPTFHVGIAEYDEGPTGCTVFAFPNSAATAMDERGGMVGRTDGYEWNDAICFAGGSIYGLEVPAGVTAELIALRHPTLDNMACVSGAIIFDFGRRDNLIYPDKALGRAALVVARPNIFPLGPRGAGRSAGCGGIFDFARAESSGQGAAFRQVGDTKIAVFTVVNALGAIVNREGKVVRGNRDPHTGERIHPLTDLEHRIATGQLTTSPAGNTTLTMLITNQKLDTRSLQQLARQVHSSMARAIIPFHTLMDGDLLYATTTNEIENPQLSIAALGILASELAWDAILSIFL